MDHFENVTAAAMLAVADRVRTAAEEAAGRAGAGAAALTMLHGWADGRPIEALASALHLSHSRAVRVVDKLAADGLVVRERDVSDARRALVRLTSAGRRTCDAILLAREDAIRDALAALDGDQREALAAIAEAIVADAVSSRTDARHLCRFCDTEACGHHDGRCPATRKADQIEDATA